MNYGNYYSREQVMRYADISLATFYAYLRKGIIKAPALMVGNRFYLYTAEERKNTLKDIEQWRYEKKNIKQKEEEKINQMRFVMLQNKADKFKSICEQMHKVNTSDNIEKYIFLLSEQRFNQWEIAKILNIPQSSVSRVLNGKKLRSSMKNG